MEQGIRRLKNLRTRQNVCGNILVGFSFLLLTLLTVKLLAPQIDAEAAQQTASQSIGPWSMSMSNDSAASINITPTASQAVYTATNNLSVTNTCTAGATITMTTNSTTSNALVRSGSDSLTKEIAATTSSALDNNSWGYSIDNGTTYAAVPKKGQTVATVYDESQARTTAYSVPVMFGVKTDNNMPSGTYTNDVIYTMTPKQGCLTYAITWEMNGGTAKSGATYPTSLNFGTTLDLSALAPTRSGNYLFAGWTNGTDVFSSTETAADVNSGNSSSITLTALWASPMQAFSCSSITSTGQKIYLYDTRDNNIYAVAKLTDGNCWMTQNLRLIGKTLTSSDSNISASSWTLPAANWSDSLDSTDKFTNAYTYDTGNTDYGVYYNYTAATAGTISGGSSTTKATYDICPKGWKLPSSAQQTALLSAYNVTDDAAGSTIMRSNPLNFIYSGVISDISTSPSGQGTSGYWWSSSPATTTSRDRISITSSRVTVASSNRRSGLSVRCVAKELTMQSFDKSTLTTVGESVELEDERDGEKYTVTKLADDNVWMTENLRLINKTLTSSDSNISASSWILPAANWSDSLDSTDKYANAYTYDTGNADYGVYYNYAAATAGTKSGASVVGEATYDICPKGWKLPSKAQQIALLSAYNVTDDAAGSTIMRSAPLNFVYSGYIDYNSTSPSGQGTSGRWWSSSPATTTVRIRIGIDSSSARATSGNTRSAGCSVRCMAK